MRIKIVGTCEAAIVLRNKLPLAGFLVSEGMADFTFFLEETHDKTHIVLDSIPCPIEQLVLFHISQLTKTDIAIKRQTGEIFSDVELKITIPDTTEDSNAVELGIIRALLNMVKPRVEAVAPLAPVK